MLLLVATAANADDLDLDGNVVAKRIVEFARMMNLTSVTVCLPIPRPAKDPLPIFLQDINISIALELTWNWYKNYSCKFLESLNGDYTLRA